ncbi:hypothetical protein ACOSP7_019898 [Xanthoceras sorbifolium]
MDVQKQSTYSLKSCSFFLFIFLVLIVITLGGVTLIIIFIVKPQKPKFSVENLRVESFDVSSRNYSSTNPTLFVSSVVSLVLNAQNPNKLGIKYSPSRLHLCLEGLPVGVIRVPGFNQPAESNNVNVATRVLIYSLNVTRIVSGDLSKDDYRKNNVVRMELSGDVPLSLQLFRITILKIKVYLKCDINVDYTELTFINEVNTIRVSQIYKASFPVDQSKSSIDNCDIAIYI